MAGAQGIPSGQNPGRKGSVPMKRLANSLCNLPEYVIGAFVILVSLVVFIQIVFRYFLNFSLGWSDELARILFIWISLLGAAVCVKRGQHFAFGVIAARLERKSRHILNAGASLMVLGFCLFFIWYGYKSFILSFYQNFIVLEVSWAWAFAAVPISGVLMCLYSIPTLLGHMKALRDNK
jgi:TRAP-type C4-dicarboxylate transport system permease small subunit